MEGRDIGTDLKGSPQKSVDSTLVDVEIKRNIADLVLQKASKTVKKGGSPQKPVDVTFINIEI